MAITAAPLRTLLDLLADIYSPEETYDEMMAMCCVYFMTEVEFAERIIRLYKRHKRKRLRASIRTLTHTYTHTHTLNVTYRGSYSQ
jgi:hypothetical protein